MAFASGQNIGPDEPKKDQSLLGSPMDDQELMDRADAAASYAEEDPQHFVSYGQECLEEARYARTDQRLTWDRCWEAYNLIRDYSQKEDWQCKVITPDPFTTVQQAKAVVRKALVDRVDYFDIKGTLGVDVALSKFWKAALTYWLDEQRSNFPLSFANATEMSFVAGPSMEMVPRWVKFDNGSEGLVWDLVPPWHIFRDPDAVPGNPWSGLFWIHQEWVDLWYLKHLGIYENLDMVEGGGPENFEDSQERDRTRAQQQWTRNQYRTAVLVNEFWGTVLSKKGELLLQNAKYTFSNRTLISKPKPSPYPSIRWPGVSFSALFHLMRFEGRGILEGTLSLWELSDNLLNAHGDDLNWVINRQFEVDYAKLLDGGQDSEVYPGKIWGRKSGAPQGAAVAEVATSRSRTVDVLPNMQYLANRWEKGTFVNEFVQGLPGTRSKITKGETLLKTEQSMGMMESMGRNLEMGAMWAIRAAMEVLAVNWTDMSKPGIEKVFGDEVNPQFLSNLRLLGAKDRLEALRLNADISVKGISSNLRKTEMLKRMDALMKKAESPVWNPYFDIPKTLKVAVDALDLAEEGILKEPSAVKIQPEATPGQQKPVVPGAAQPTPPGTPIPGQVPAPKPGGA